MILHCEPGIPALRRWLLLFFLVSLLVCSLCVWLRIFLGIFFLVCLLCVCCLCVLRCAAGCCGGCLRAAAGSLVGLATCRRR